MSQAKAKANSVVTSQWVDYKDGRGTTLEITVLGAGMVVFDPTKASEDNRVYAERHGWLQRLMDAAAIPAPTRKAGGTEEEWLRVLQAHKQAKFDGMAELAEYYQGGEVPWKRTGGGVADQGLLFTALCEFKPKVPAEKLREFIKGQNAQGLAELRAIPGIVDIMNRLRKERVAKVDVKSALKGLDALETIAETENAE